MSTPANAAPARRKPVVNKTESPSWVRHPHERAAVARAEASARAVLERQREASLQDVWQEMDRVVAVVAQAERRQRLADERERLDAQQARAVRLERRRRLEREEAAVREVDMEIEARAFREITDDERRSRRRQRQDAARAREEEFRARQAKEKQQARNDELEEGVLAAAQRRSGDKMQLASARFADLGSPIAMGRGDASLSNSRLDASVDADARASASDVLGQRAMEVDPRFRARQLADDPSPGRATRARFGYVTTGSGPRTLVMMAPSAASACKKAGGVEVSTAQGTRYRAEDKSLRAQRRAHAAAATEEAPAWSPERDGQPSEDDDEDDTDSDEPDAAAPRTLDELVVFPPAVLQSDVTQHARQRELRTLDERRRTLIELHEASLRSRTHSRPTTASLESHASPPRRAQPRSLLKPQPLSPTALEMTASTIKGGGGLRSSDTGPKSGSSAAAHSSRTLATSGWASPPDRPHPDWVFITDMVGLLQRAGRGYLARVDLNAATFDARSQRRARATSDEGATRAPREEAPAVTAPETKKGNQMPSHRQRRLVGSTGDATLDAFLSDDDAELRRLRRAACPAWRSEPAWNPTGLLIGVAEDEARHRGKVESKRHPVRRFRGDQSVRSGTTSGTGGQHGGAVSAPFYESLEKELRAVRLAQAHQNAECGLPPTGDPSASETTAAKKKKKTADTTATEFFELGRPGGHSGGELRAFGTTVHSTADLIRLAQRLTATERSYLHAEERHRREQYLRSLETEVFDKTHALRVAQDKQLQQHASASTAAMRAGHGNIKRRERARLHAKEEERRAAEAAERVKFLNSEERDVEAILRRVALRREFLHESVEEAVARTTNLTPGADRHLSTVQRRAEEAAAADAQRRRFEPAGDDVPTLQSAPGGMASNPGSFRAKPHDDPDDANALLTRMTSLLLTPSFREPPPDSPQTKRRRKKQQTISAAEVARRSAEADRMAAEAVQGRRQALRAQLAPKGDRLARFLGRAEQSPTFRRATTPQV